MLINANKLVLLAFISNFISIYKHIGRMLARWCTVGSISDTYRPMPAPKSAEETPQKCRPDAKSSALLEKWPCSSPLEGVWTASRNPQPFWDVPQGCPAQLGLGAGQTEIFNWGSGAQKAANGVRFRYVQADAGTKIGRGDPAKMSA